MFILEYFTVTVWLIKSEDLRASLACARGIEPVINIHMKNYLVFPNNNSGKPTKVCFTQKTEAIVIRDSAENDNA